MEEEFILGQIYSKYDIFVLGRYEERVFIFVFIEMLGFLKIVVLVKGKKGI